MNRALSDIQIIYINGILQKADRRIFLPSSYSTTSILNTVRYSYEIEITF